MATQNNNPMAHLHYGGSLNPKTAKLGPKPQQGRMFKVQKRLETIVRLENAGIGEAAAAAMLCISIPRLRYIKKSAEYLNARIKITHGLIVDHEKNLAQIKEQRREILTQMLPPALQLIANELQSQDASLMARRHRTSLALEILDREGTFAKVSRTEIKPVDAFSFEAADAESRSIISALRGAAAPPSIGSENTTHTIEAVEANEAFSNSHTLSATDQEKALAKLEEEAALLELPLNGPIQ